MKYQHIFRVRAPQAAVAAFHRRSEALRAITPPPIIVQLHAAPPTLGEGDEMDFTLWLGPVPIRWVAHIERVTPESFVDRQVRGPFRRWEHTHSFVKIGDHCTEVRDAIDAEPGEGLYRKLVSLGMWLGLPILFAYRGWKTRRMLER